MSIKNGNKSRFHRERKQKIARRKRTQELMKATSQHTKGSTAVRSTAHSVSE